MSQLIDVSDLQPEEVRAIEELVENFRKRAARTTPPAAGEIQPRDMPYEEWAKWFRAWIDSHEKRDIEIDDSRETIYAGRGE